MSKQVQNEKTTPSTSNEDHPFKAKVVSIDQARTRRYVRPRRPKAPAVDHESLDLKEAGADRLTPEAREALRLRVERYAQRLTRCAGNFSEADNNKSGAKIAVKHVRAATRMPSLNPSAKPPQFGWNFALDAAQVVGAVTIGALCANQSLLGSSGYVSLAVAVAVTVSAFVAKEALAPH